MKNLFFRIVLFFLYSGFATAFPAGTPVGPGVVHHHEFRQAGPWHINVLEIDLSVPWLQLKTVKANNRLVGRELTSAMATRHDAEMHRVVGAINGDFFEADGKPVGAQVLNGILLKRPGTHSVFGCTNQKVPLLDVVSFEGQLRTKEGLTIQIDGINETRTSNTLIVYNKYSGSTTGTLYAGTEITVTNLEEYPVANDTTRVLAVAKDSIMTVGHGNNAIPEHGFVLSGHGAASLFLNDNIFIGDTLLLVFRLPPLNRPIVELIGGTPRLIRDGAISIEWQAEGINANFVTDRHPRTALGFTQDSTKLYFFTVDGRQPGYSVGMSLVELANYMQEWKVYQGVNLDGGGSTTLVVRGRVVNSPSDIGGERAVSNSLMIVSTAPTSPLAILTITPAETYVLSGSEVQFSISGVDQYYNPVIVSGDSLVWHCDPMLGTINEAGMFTAANDTITGFVSVTSGNICDSAIVHVTDIAAIDLLPNPIILKVGETYAITAHARDNYGNRIELAKTAYQWSVTGGVGEITPDGVFTATKTGDGYVTAEYRNIMGSTLVSVGTAADLVIDNFTDAANWNLSGLLVNLPECRFSLDGSRYVSSPSSAKLEYRLSPGGTSVLYLNCSITIAGTPEAVGIHLYGDGKGHWLRGEFADADNEKFLLNFTEATPGIDWVDSWKYLRVSLDKAVPHWANPGAILTFPIKWTKIYLAETDESKKGSGTMYFDDFTVHFIKTGIEGSDNATTPFFFGLEQNYPNPFNSGTSISYSLSKYTKVNIEIYDLSGKLVKTLINNYQYPGRKTIHWNGKNEGGEKVSSGIYFCTLEAGNLSGTKKMLLLK